MQQTDFKTQQDDLIANSSSKSCAKATITENHAALPREVEVEARADAALIKGLPAPLDGGKRHRRRGNQTEAVNRSGINALHWELRGQTAPRVTGNHTREQQTIASRAAWG